MVFCICILRLLRLNKVYSNYHVSTRIDLILGVTLIKYANVEYWQRRGAQLFGMITRESLKRISRLFGFDVHCVSFMVLALLICLTSRFFLVLSF